MELKELRKGYTTGTCAQAAAKAAVMMLTSGKIVETVNVATASGAKLNINLSDQEIGAGFAHCSVIKDSGDDPDITNGAKVFAEVRFSDQPGIILKGGKGVGRVTKPGLAVAVGEWAINPVPRKMILKELLPYTLSFPRKRESRHMDSPVKPGNDRMSSSAGKLLEKKGLEVIISVPRGEELAKQTFNPRLGIEGGISILGTTGIVEPKSLAAYKASLSLQLDVIKASGQVRAALVPGYVGEKFCKEVLGIKDDIIVKIGDHIGFMFEECVKKGIREVIFAGHIGKLVKVANGQFNTHCQHGDGRVDTIARYARMSNAPEEIIQELYLQETAESAGEILRKNNLSAVFDLLAKAVVEKLNELVKSALKINCYILSLQGEVLGSLRV